LFLSGQRNTLVIPARALAQKYVPLSVLTRHSQHFRDGDSVSLATITTKLVQAGYLRVPVVEEPGELAVRGGLLDLWATGSAQPVRIELDADTITSLRLFDPTSQKSGAKASAITVPPAREALLIPEARERAARLVQSLCDKVDYPTLKAKALLDDVASGNPFFGSQALLPAYSSLEPLTEMLDPSTVVVLENPSAIVKGLREALQAAERGEAQASERPHFPLQELYLDESTLAEQLLRYTALAAHPTAVHHSDLATSSIERLEAAPLDAPSLGSDDQSDLSRALRTAQSERGNDEFLEPLARALAGWQDAGYQTMLTARTATQADRLQTLLSHRGFDVGITDISHRPAVLRSLSIAVAPLARGVVLAGNALVLLTEEEIFGKRRHRRQQRSKAGALTAGDLRNLQVDDFVVHVEHGIGRYKGLTHRQVGEIWIDLLVVEYSGGDKLFLPVYRLNQIQKHASAEALPKLDRLGGQTFTKTKARVRRRVREMADELLRLYAERMSVKRAPLPDPSDDYQTFEAGFPFEETPDQAGAIADVIGDLQRDVVMDRLVCGDVGFGKTEVALRAAFLNIMEGRQVALLCPTTVLAQQHFLTFQKRLEQYPVVVRPLSRFQSRKQITETLLGAKQGNVDVVVGTHRLLSKDVHFKRLGLLVVDEEQRFGVTHKERIKQLRTNVDVLTLSATPIPRTLQMAVSGIRDLSMISTPPIDRRGVRTIVSRPDDGIIKAAVERELARGGQIFYVYNRIEGLESRAHRLTTLFPKLRVAVAHGQQTERQLERMMLGFVSGDYDILCSTAIVENGLDIPRANTMLVDRADMLGLSQLYQLRGRVGRSYQQAYCYLMVPPASRMTDVARSRIEAMQRYTELGSGFQIATMDMELRGAGDLLGAEQSGFVESVGFELFCQMLREATLELSEHAPAPEVDPDLSFDVEALIPEDYVDDVGVRLSVYKRLASADSLSEVDSIATELIDRFGHPPEAVRRLVALMNLKVELRQLRALSCEASADRVTLHLNHDTPLSAARIGLLAQQSQGQFALSPTGKLTRRRLATEQFRSGIEHTNRMLNDLKAQLDTR
jgi:transcription-repair coupling factor (superfamily II helicase)